MKHASLIIKHFFVAAVCATFIPIFSVSAQEYSSPDRWIFGVFGHYSANSHAVDFKELSGFPVPPATARFGNAYSGGFAGGILAEAPLSAFLGESALASSIRFGLRGAYQTFGATLYADEPTTFIDQKTLAPVAGTIRHSIDAPLASFGVEPIIGVSFFDNFRLHIGARIASMTAKTFTQKAEITAPSQPVFVPGSRTWNEQSAEIPSASTTLSSALFGVSYMIPLNTKRTWLIIPEVYNSTPFGDISDAVAWSVRSLRAGIALAYSPIPAKKIINDTLRFYDTSSVRMVAGISQERVVLSDTTMSVLRAEDERVIRQTITLKMRYARELPMPKEEEKPPILTVKMSPSAVLENGAEAPLDTLLVDQAVNNTFTPLLNYVFFDHNSSVLPTRYRELNANQASAFSLKDVKNASTLETYYHVLNIVGLRMREHPSATLTITGCNSDNGEEERNSNLSRNRAESVQTYLMKAWNISPQRLKMSSRNLPKNPSNTKETDGVQENRRVEITSDESAIFAPVFVSDTSLRSPARTLRFRPRAESEAGIRDWKVELRTESAKIGIKSGVGNLPETVDFTLDSAALSALKGTSLRYSLEVSDRKNQNAKTEPAEISIGERQMVLSGGISYESDRYSLLLFEFDNAELSRESRGALDFIRNRLGEQSRISIEGTTDRLGDEKHNTELSRKRALMAAKVLRRNDAKIEGKGEDTTTFPNDLPEGRFYSRTVNILVEKEKK